MATHPPSPLPEPEFTFDEELLHTPAYPFCSDMRCPCHENVEAQQETNEFVQDGLLSTDDADRFYRGRMLHWSEGEEGARG